MSAAVAVVVALAAVSVVVTVVHYEFSAATFFKKWVEKMGPFINKWAHFFPIYLPYEKKWAHFLINVAKVPRNGPICFFFFLFFFE